MVQMLSMQTATCMLHVSYNCKRNIKHSAVRVLQKRKLRACVWAERGVVGPNFIEFISGAPGAPAKTLKKLRSGLIFIKIFQICGVE